MKRLAILTMAGILACSDPAAPVQELCACPSPLMPMGLLYGTLRHSDGTPATGLQVRAGYISYYDSALAWSSFQLVRTDTLGAYRMSVMAAEAGSNVFVGVQRDSAVVVLSDTPVRVRGSVDHPRTDSTEFNAVLPAGAFP